VGKEDCVLKRFAPRHTHFLLRIRSKNDGGKGLNMKIRGKSEHEGATGYILLGLLGIFDSGSVLSAAGMNVKN
jgi:hypothetical protein